MKASIRNTSTGIVFTMRLVPKGERYGLRNVLKHDGDTPLIEFYDSRYPHSNDPTGEMLGQFVSRYDVETLMKAPNVGLCLDGGNREVWSLDRDTFDLARQLIHNWLDL